jgi:hypothetical protein
MSIEFDDKGKFYTDIVAKITVPAMIQTTTHRISGLLHIRPHERVTDELDREEPFLPVTSAIVFGPQGEILFQTEYLALRRAQIVWIIPEEQPEQRRPPEGEQPEQKGPPEGEQS